MGQFAPIRVAHLLVSVDEPLFVYRRRIFCYTGLNELVTTLTTDEDGRAISGDLPYGVYIVKERPMESYVTLPPFEVNISEDSKIYFYNIFNDKFRAEIEIYKTDSETGKKIPAAGVEFKIKDSEGNFVKHTVTYPQKYETDVFTTDETGSVHLPEPLEYSDYFITEIRPPAAFCYWWRLLVLPPYSQGSI